MNRDDLVTKRPILADPPQVNRDEPRKGPLTDIVLPKTDAAQEFNHPRKRVPVEVEADIKPLVRRSNPTIVAYLKGGPFDGVELDLPAMTMTHQAVVETPAEELTPFVFDAEQHRAFVESKGERGRPNIVKGEHDTITYKRTSEKTADGAVVFVAA